ncbi:MAG: hypothetical protein KY468_19220 [Armatimonadetes bacterium]|nr:hypothetical protein [Armatimonadota bacterium]
MSSEREERESSELYWKPDCPSILVIACSDGRLEEQTDRFLKQELGIQGYDRLYVPGGPGALADSGFEYERADRMRKECRFLVEAHQIREVILIFHGNSEEGPEEAMCADYVRKLPDLSNAQLRAQQMADVRDVMHMVFGWPPDLRISAYRAEVGPDHSLRFVELAKR